MNLVKLACMAIGFVEGVVTMIVAIVVYVEMKNDEKKKDT